MNAVERMGLWVARVVAQSATKDPGDAQAALARVVISLHEFRARWPETFAPAATGATAFEAESPVVAAFMVAALAEVGGA